VLSAPAIASAAAAHPGSHTAQARPALPAGERYACPAVPVGQMACMSIIKTSAGSGFAALAGIPAAQAALTPSDLRRAYKLVTISPRNGRGRIVGIVDAFNDPHAEADLKVYRSHFHLPPCTKSNGCLRILNEHGKSSPLPRANVGWALEESLDLDMVSAICPLCHITLIESSTASDTNLGISENTAIARGARYVSNSWGNFEFAGENSFTHFFNHPGHVINFASGDLGFGPTFPADLQFVTSVGGTALHHASNSRGWTESVWGTSANSPRKGTASGCSVSQAKPSWQRVDATIPNGCQNRTENDASAVADPNTGVVVYDTYHLPGPVQVGGTSASTPIITGIYALAGAPVKNTYPAEYMYLKSSHLFDVTSGANGTCGAATYLCHGITGYDGPTGLGTPNGTAAFSIRAVTRVTLVDPGSQTAHLSQAFSLKITGLDTRTVSSLTYAMTTVPGLSIKPVAHTTNATISGTPTTPGTYNVTVTAKDGSATGTTHFTLVVS
jgi:hypothetical protein